MHRLEYTVQCGKIIFCSCFVKCRLEMGKIFVKHLRHAARNQPWRWPLCFNPMLLCNLTGPWPWGRDDMGLIVLIFEASTFSELLIMSTWSFNRQSVSFDVIGAKRNLWYKKDTAYMRSRQPAFSFQNEHHINFIQTKSLKRFKYLWVSKNSRPQRRWMPLV